MNTEIKAAGQKVPSPLYVTKMGKVVLLYQKGMRMGHGIVLHDPEEEITRNEVARTIEVRIMDLVPFNGTLTMSTE